MVALKAKFYLLALLAVLVSIITLASFMKVQRYAFFNRSKAKSKVKEVPFSMAFSMIVMAVLCIALSFLLLPGLREIVLQPAVDVLLKTKEYSITILGF